MTLQGIYLPVIFAHGYLYAFQAVMGRSNVDSYYQAAANNWVSSSTDLADKSLFEPLYCYFGEGLGIPEPLDYFFLRLIQAGLLQSMPDKEGLIKKITRKVGKVWWYGDAPISTYQDRQSLSYLLRHIIVEKLDEFKFGATNIDHSSVKSSRKLINLGVQIFIEEFSRQSNVNCHLDTTDNSQLVFTVNSCPFCTQQSASCHVFIGLIEAFLEWAHGTYQVNAVPTHMAISDSQSTGHRVILNLM